MCCVRRAPALSKQTYSSPAGWRRDRRAQLVACQALDLHDVGRCAAEPSGDVGRTRPLLEESQHPPLDRPQLLDGSRQLRPGQVGQLHHATYIRRAPAVSVGDVGIVDTRPHEVEDAPLDRSKVLLAVVASHVGLPQLEFAAYVPASCHCRQVRALLGHGGNNRRRGAQRDPPTARRGGPEHIRQRGWAPPPAEHATGLCDRASPFRARSLPQAERVRAETPRRHGAVPNAGAHLAQHDHAWPLAR